MSYNSSNWILDGVAAMCGALLGCYPLDRQIYPSLSFKNWWRQTLAWWVMRFGVWAILVVACFVMPEIFCLQMILVTCIYLLLHLLLSWGFFLKFWRLIKILKRAGQRLQQIVDFTAAKMGKISVRASWEMGGYLANAFAFPITHELVFSERTLKICTDEEVAAICAHELAHLSESKFIVTARVLGSLTFFPLIFLKPALHSFGPYGLFVPYVFVFIMLRLTKWLSQKMEKRADAFAAKEQADEGVYARALEKLYRDNVSPAVNVNNRQSHPHLYDRMVAAGITPDYPRPARPKRFTLIGWAFLVALGVFIGLDIHSYN